MIGLLCLFASLSAKGQVLQFSQPWAFASYLNPAFTATGEQGTLHMGYMQFSVAGWNDYAAYYAGADYYVDALHGGVGMSIIGEREAEGALQTYQAGASYAFQFQVSKRIVASLGLQAQLLLRQYNPAAFVFEDMLRGLTASNTGEVFEKRVRYLPDFSVGGVISWPQFFVGTSVRHLNAPSLEGVSSPWPRQFGLQIGYEKDLYHANGIRSGAIIPNLVFNYQSNLMEFRPGVYYQNASLLVGGWMRIQQPMAAMGGVLMVGYQWEDYQFAYSFASHFDKLAEKNVNSTVHQVTFLMHLQYKQGVKKVRAIKCPKI